MSDTNATRNASAAWLAAGVGLLALLVPSWGGAAPLLAAALLTPLGGGRWLLPLAALPLAVIDGSAAGLAVGAALFLADTLPLPRRLLAVALALAAGAGGMVATGTLDLTVGRTLAGVAMGALAFPLALLLPEGVATVAGATVVSLTATLVWGWAPIPFPGYERIAEGLFVAGGLAIAAHVAGKLDRPGVAAGTVVGAAVFTLTWWGGFLLMTLFVLLGVGVTRSTPHAGERHEVRGAPHVIANIGPALLFAVAAGMTGSAGLLIAFVGALAAATADTLSAELGRRWGEPPVDLFTLAPLPAGTDGAVSAGGTLFGGMGALAVALAGWGLAFYGGGAVVAVTLGGMSGSLADSALGALYERRGALGNHRVNFLGAAAGGLAALGLSQAL